MIKQSIKKVVFDKNKALCNLYNWQFVDTSFRYLDYECDGDFNLSKSYDDEYVSYVVEGVGLVEVNFDIYHTWDLKYDSGDYYTPPSYTVENEDIVVDVTSITVDGELETPEGMVLELMERLEVYVLDTVIYGLSFH